MKFLIPIIGLILFPLLGCDAEYDLKEIQRTQSYCHTFKAKYDAIKPPPKEPTFAIKKQIVECRDAGAWE